MSGSNTKLTRRRVLGGLLTVGTAGAAAGAGTMAAFEDSESSSDNGIQAGTLTLDFGSSGSFSFDTGLAPNDTTTDSVTLVNGGSVTGSLDVDVSYTESDADSNDTDVSATQLAQSLEVETLTYGGTDLVGQVGGSSPPTLDDLANNDQTSGEAVGNDLIDLADPGTAGTEFTVGLRLKDVGNDYQSDGVSITFTFHLNQNDGQ